MMACNARNGRVISTDVSTAERLFSRMKGLLGRSGLKEGESLLIRPCKGIHTIGMRFPLDALFLSRSSSVIGIREGIPPNRISAVFPDACAVLELPAGTIFATGTEIGDEVLFKEETA
jgi:hypothetical protein